MTCCLHLIDNSLLGVFVGGPLQGQIFQLQAHPDETLSTTRFVVFGFVHVKGITEILLIPFAYVNMF